MKTSHKLLILDDDLHYTGMLALKLKARFPELKVSSSTQKTLINGYDIYILDNDFNGQKCGAKLAEQVRQQAPHSLVIILSGTLELGPAEETGKLPHSWCFSIKATLRNCKRCMNLSKPIFSQRPPSRWLRKPHLLAPWRASAL